MSWRPKLSNILDAIFTGTAIRTTTVIDAGDLQLGAVAIKDGTGETVAAVGANGLAVDVKATVSSDIEKASIGHLGGVYITGTAATTPEAGKVFVALLAIEDTVINTSASNITGLTGISLTQGMVLYGRFTSVTLTSGKVLAYLGV